MEEAMSKCPYCDHDGHGSHYHCPNCGEVCGMYGHYDGHNYTCEYKPNPVADANPDYAGPKASTFLSGGESASAAPGLEMIGWSPDNAASYAECQEVCRKMADGEKEITGTGIIIS